MATTSRSVAQIKYNVAQGISSYDDLHTMLSRYEQLMQDVKEVDPQLWKVYKSREKQA